MIKLRRFSKNLTELNNSFTDLPRDEYLRGDFFFRQRRYQTGHIAQGLLSWHELAGEFMQAENINHYAGGVYRKFPPILSSCLDDIGRHIVMTAYHALPEADYEFGVHQIRIVADEDHAGRPTPEGIHQDGFDYVAVSCVGVQNLSGGTSVIVKGDDYCDVVFEADLSPGDMLIFSDRLFAHYTSNIIPRLPGVAVRDVVVTTFLTRPTISDIKTKDSSHEAHAAI